MQRHFQFRAILDLRQELRKEDLWYGHIRVFPGGETAKGCHHNYHSLFLFIRWWCDFQISKACLTGLEKETDLPDRSITMLRYNDIRDILAFCLWIIHILSINEHHDIRVLFDRIFYYYI